MHQDQPCHDENPDEQNPEEQTLEDPGAADVVAGWGTAPADGPDPAAADSAAGEPEADDPALAHEELLPPPRKRRLPRFRLTPREDSYFDMFAGLAQHLVTGANLLAEMLGATDRPTRKAVAKRIAEAEHAADDATHEIMRKLNQTFVTPFDRDDIYALASALDDCMDYMEEVADMVVLYRVDVLPPRVADQIQVLQRAAELTAEAMPRLRSMDSLSEYWVEVNRLENQADKAHRKLLAQLFDDVVDPIELMKLKEIVETLELAADGFERVANIVETIALKES